MDAIDQTQFYGPYRLKCLDDNEVAILNNTEAVRLAMGWYWVRQGLLALLTPPSPPG